MNKKPKIALEAAQQEFHRFANAMDLDTDLSNMDDEDKKSFQQQQKRIVTAIQEGSIVVNDNGEPLFTPQRTKNAEAITFYEPTGASLMAMDRKKKNEDIGKLYSTMAEITKLSPNTFAKMKMADLKICLAVTTLFLG